MSDAASRPSLWESPWYWIHLFSIAALIGSVVIGPKFVRRQGGVERRFEGRQRAALRHEGDTSLPPSDGAAETPPEMSANPAVDVSGDDRGESLWPVQVACGLAAIVSWVFVWRIHLRPRFVRPRGTGVVSAN